MTLSSELARLGLAQVVSAGNEAVLDVGDYVEWFADEDRITVIALFLESIRDPASFAAACARAHANGKEIVALKVGRSETARRAIAAHSAGIAGDHQIVDAYFADLGVKAVGDLDELVNSCELMVRYRGRPKRPGCVVVTMSGGEAALVADIASDVGLSLPALGAQASKRLREHLPPFVTPANPLDSYGLGYTQQRFEAIARALMDDAGVGTVTVATDALASGDGDAILARQMATVIGELATQTATRFVVLNNTSGAGRDVETDRVLSAAGVPFLLGLREGLAALTTWTSELRTQRTHLSPQEQAKLAELARKLVRAGETERFALLSELGLPMVQTVRIHSQADASEAARKVGFPVVMKGAGPHIAHKAERGLVRANLCDDSSVRDAYSEITALLDHNDLSGANNEVVIQQTAVGELEVIVGVRNDTAFGSVVVVGLGGIYTEIFGDSSVALGPVDAAMAKRLLDRTHVGPLLRGRRDGRSYDLDAIAETIALLSRLGAAAQETIAAIEVNPLLVGIGSVTAVDLLIDPQAGTTEARET